MKALAEDQPRRTAGSRRRFGLPAPGANQVPASVGPAPEPAQAIWWSSCRCASMWSPAVSRWARVGATGPWWMFCTALADQRKRAGRLADGDRRGDSFATQPPEARCRRHQPVVPAGAGAQAATRVTARPMSITFVEGPGSR
ncbi:hypothetical protein ADK65_24325 [Streptomyces sp. NRRL B-1140]|nr:hypothetical protein ADK65_24325 [Streptomyces sp. NRRL B-1140]